MFLIVHHGTEFCGELAAFFKEKDKNESDENKTQITIISAREVFLERCCAAAHMNVSNYFASCGNVNTILGEKVIGFENGGRVLVTTRGKKIDSDLVFACLGFVPNSEFIRAGSPQVLNKIGQVKVNSFLQVPPYQTVFAVGDLTNVAEEKLAQCAERHADIVSYNIAALEKGNQLTEYKSSHRVLLISLGPREALCVYREKVVFDNRLVSIAKQVVEKRVMRGYK